MAPQLSSRQFLHAGVEGNQNAVPFHRLPEEQSVRPLLMSPDSCGQGLQAGGYLAIQRPEFMSRVAGGFAQDRQGGRRADRALGYGGIGEQTQHAKLRQRIGGPSVLARLREPGMSGSMALVAGPKQSEQEVDIRQMAIHSSSQSSRTRALVMTGKSSDASKTVSPFTFRVPT